MKQKLHALDAFFIEKLKLSENDPNSDNLVHGYALWDKQLYTTYEFKAGPLEVVLLFTIYTQLQKKRTTYMHLL